MTYSDLIESERLPVRFAAVIQEVYQPLVRTIVSLHSQRGRCIVVGINGCQGSGKSTMAMFLQRILVGEYGLRTVTLSLDDLYFTKGQRKELSRTVHPLLATRGVPGTHDLELGGNLIDSLLHADADDETAIPRFDKGVDDRASEQGRDPFHGKPDIIILEGWCVGITALADEELSASPNSMELKRDADGRWRKYVNRQISGPYADFFKRLDCLIMLKAPSFDVVYQWRQEQEQKLRQAGATEAMSDEELEQFVMHYERWTRHMLNELPSRADVLVELDTDRHAGIVGPGR